ncbi:alanine racemase [Acetobacter sp. AN02]|uniref:alanine racemase n=1 Tax=Acetobacter sp. AN02 TaxID=2894186 RepID=UPI0024344D58|nr:alanine racemase [Acetobacter sp. AN02]MDG6095477.1 alanine racemase [Acetobacter sp. AN02]
MASDVPSPAADRAGGILTIDPSAVAENYRRVLRVIGPGVKAAAAVKADAYGLGVENIAPALYGAGCRHFFVAHLAEGMVLRPLLPSDASVLVLHGPPPGTAGDLHAAGLIPVLNSPDQIAEWSALAQSRESSLPAVVQIDSGMARFGLSEADLHGLARKSDALSGIDVSLVMSHLACADEPEHPANRAQLLQFERLRGLLPPAPYSLAASSGLFLGSDWHFDLVRPGAALYGVNPTPYALSPVCPVIRLSARVIQTRDVQAGQAVGYGAAFVAGRASRIALLGIGYGDGYLRSAGGRARVSLPSHPELHLPVTGRISMDSLCVDVTGAPEGLIREGVLLDLIGPHLSIDEAASSAGTIGYELLTGLGGRYHRVIL